MERINVNLGKRSYPIFIEHGILGNISKIVREYFSDRKILVITDSNVVDLYARQIAAGLENEGFQTFVEVVPAGEVSKSLARAEDLYNAALDHRLDRKSAILALGGGVVGDLAGFIAATYMRGIGFIQVPTTLLAQVDSSVGGKVAVNLPRAKNIVGAFYQPKLVIIDPDTLLSLPEREFAEGLAEVIKYGIIRDEDFFRWLEQYIKNLRQNTADLVHAIKRSCEIKAEIVSEDEAECGLRMVLNFGHTVGHALEAVFGYGTLLHGEAVALGMVFEAKIALNRGLIDERTFLRIEGLVKSAVPKDLPHRPDPDSLIESMSFDKKNLNEKITFILPERLGRVGVYSDITAKEILQAIVP
ncbi:3-dehydroquinate synthase [Thermoanaerobacteraceae bacterium SP2]|nr:3-dehydroquinate synthase [Thermoanaerobacteraceae bacterium SP2]